MGVESMAKKVLTWGTIAFLVFFVAFSPATAARAVRALGDWVMGLFS